MCFVINAGLPEFLSRGATKIFSRAGLPFRDSCQNGIHDVSGMVEGELERATARVRDDLQDPRFTASFSVVRKPPAPSLLRMACRRSMSPSCKHGDRETLLPPRGDSGGAHLGEELFGARDAAEDDSARRAVRENEFALDSPDGLLSQRRMIHRPSLRAARSHRRVAATRAARAGDPRAAAGRRSRCSVISTISKSRARERC
jgi:hypothetical protein